MAAFFVAACGTSLARDLACTQRRRDRVGRRQQKISGMSDVLIPFNRLVTFRTSRTNPLVWPRVSRAAIKRLQPSAPAAEAA